MNILGGRINRATYWLGAALIGAVLATLLALSPRNAHVSQVVFLFLCAPRLHDIGRSGWWIAAPLALELLSMGLAFWLLPWPAACAAMAVLSLILAALVVWLGAAPGDPGVNRFGPPPGSGLGRLGRAG